LFSAFLTKFHREEEMREHLLITTAIGLMLGTGAFAQSASEQPRTNPPPAAQSQTNSNSPAPSQAPSAQPSNSSGQAQTNTAPSANSQAQSQPSGAASNNAANNNAGARPSTNTAEQQSNNQTNTAQSRSSNVNVSASLNERERTRVSESLSRLNAKPVTNVNFSLSVGTTIPRDVHLQPLPTDVVEVMPQYRGYDFVLVRDDIVIVEPSSYRIVDVLPRAGRSTAAASAPTSHKKITFSDRDRDVIRRHTHSSRTVERTTGSSSASKRVRVGDRLPDSVAIRSFPMRSIGNHQRCANTAISNVTTEPMWLNRANAQSSKRWTNNNEKGGPGGSPFFFIAFGGSS
jgi:Protein of unknown function (DUF1236)